MQLTLDDRYKTIPKKDRWTILAERDDWTEAEIEHRGRMEIAFSDAALPGPETRARTSFRRYARAAPACPRKANETVEGWKKRRDAEMGLDDRVLKGGEGPDARAGTFFPSPRTFVAAPPPRVPRNIHVVTAAAPRRAPDGTVAAQARGAARTSSRRTRSSRRRSTCPSRTSTRCIFRA